MSSGQKLKPRIGKKVVQKDSRRNSSSVSPLLMNLSKVSFLILKKRWGLEQSHDNSWNLPNHSGGKEIDKSSSKEGKEKKDKLKKDEKPKEGRKKPKLGRATTKMIKNKKKKYDPFMNPPSLEIAKTYAVRAVYVRNRVNCFRKRSG